MIYNFFFPTIAMVLLALLNDIAMITVSKDRVKPSPTPDRWNFTEIFATAVCLGLYNALSTLVLFALIVNTNFFPSTFGLPTLTMAEIRGILYLQVIPKSKHLWISI